MKVIEKLLFLVLLFLTISGCSTFSHKNDKCKYDICDILAQPENVDVIEIPQSQQFQKDKNTQELFNSFPFVTYRPVINFHGKFPPEFYYKINLKWRYASIEKANFWELRWNPYLYNVIYVKPFWIGNLNLNSKNLIDDIGLSYNIPAKEINILKRWIKNGGVLWIESAIYISSYDIVLNKLSYRKINKILYKLKKTKLLGHKLNIFALKAKRLDRFHTKILKKGVIISKVKSSIPNELKNVNKLLLKQKDFIGIYFTIKGNTIIADGRRVYASYVNYGKGKILTTAPFDYINVYFDGEQYRWNMLLWLLNRDR